MQEGSRRQQIIAHFSGYMRIALFLTLCFTAQPSICEQIHSAVKKGDHAAVEKMLSEDPSLISHLGPMGKTPLQIAVEMGNIDMVQLLLDHNADVNSYGKDSLRMPPITLAVLSYRTEILQLLIKKGALVDAPNESNITPLSFAALKGEVEICKILINAGANVNNKDLQGNTPLHIAASAGQEKTIELLLENGANRDIKNNYGRTAIQGAVTKKVKALIVNYAGAPPALATITHANPEIVSYNLAFSKSDRVMNYAFRKTTYDTISAEIANSFDQRLNIIGFKSVLPGDATLPQLLVDLQTAEVINLATGGQSVMLRAKIKILRNGQTKFEKEFAGSAAPIMIIQSVRSVAVKAAENLAENASSDTQLQNALRPDLN